MPFLETNSHLTTKPYNFDIKCLGNSRSYDEHGDGHKREYSEADWLVPLIRDIASLHINLSLKTVQLSPPIFGKFCEKLIFWFFP